MAIRVPHRPDRGERQQRKHSELVAVILRARLHKAAGVTGSIPVATHHPPPPCPAALPWERSRVQTVSFSSLATRKATFLLALILIASPVAGLRPMRAARFLT